VSAAASPPPDAPCLSVVMPAYNERSTIREIVGRVLAQPCVTEIIVVDDGSTDGTREVLADLAASDPRIRVELQPANRGKGAAVRRGIELAAAPFVVIQDADLEYDPVDLPALIGPLRDGLADAVYGSRFAPRDRRRVLFFKHQLGNHLLTFVSNVLTDYNLTDMETCYKAFRRELIQNLLLQSDRFGFEPEVTARLARSPAVLYEVPISYHGRTYDEGKKITWRDGVAALWFILKFGLSPRTAIEIHRPWSELPTLVGNRRGRAAATGATAGPAGSSTVRAGA
jgi:glycosyltransferase involved in cell wall biosynthesis